MIDRRIKMSDEKIEDQMQNQVLADIVRGCIINAIDNSDDSDFYESSNSDWIHKYTKKGAIPFGYVNRDFQIDILNDPSHHKVIMKSAQMGVSEIMARNCICMLCKNDRTKALYTLPTDSDVGIFSDTRVRPIFEDSPAITKWSGKGTDNLGRKQVKSSFLILRGSWDVRLAQMMDIDFLFIDEYDRQKQDIIGSLRARMDGSALRYETDYSTPTVEGRGIHPLYDLTDKKEWFVTCPKCNESQFMTEEHILYYEDDEERLDPYFGCLRCKTPLNRFSGFWKSTEKGSPGMSGFHISQAMSPMKTAADIIYTKETQAIEADYYNYTWGLPYKGAADGSTEVDYDKIVGKHGLDPEVRSGGKAVMAIDWGFPWSWAEIRTINSDGSCNIVWIECFYSQNPDDHPDRMIDLARESEAKMVLADIGYSDTRGYRLKQSLGDIFWEVASNSTGVIEPRFNLSNHHVVCFKERIVRRHFVLLKNNKIWLPKDRDIITFSKENKMTRSDKWIEHHKSLSITPNREGVDQLVKKSGSSDHLALTSSYCDVGYEYILKHTVSEVKQKRKISIHRMNR